MKTNTRDFGKVPNGQGFLVREQKPFEQLRRTVLSCLLWENSFYEDGVTIAQRIKDLVAKVNPQDVASLAVEAREQGKLRHVPLLLARELARNEKGRPFVAETLGKIVQRPDELSEFLALYWSEGKTPIANSVKKGLATAFNKFGEYALAKYNRDNAIKLRDVMFLCHPKPKDEIQAALFKKLANNELATPDTWEVELSAGKGENKKASWERLLSENKLGALALLKNLRNFTDNGVSDNLIISALRNCNPERVLPYRFISAAKYAPRFEQYLEELMFKSLSGMDKIKGKTVLMIDLSGSMNNQLSAKSELKRIDAANGLAILARELCEEVVIYGFANSEKLIPARRGFALRDAIMQKFGGGTYLKKSMEAINAKESFDRLIVISDEESQDGVGEFKAPTYILNVSTSKNGVGYQNKVTHIHGFSESSLNYIQQLERMTQE